MCLSITLDYSKMRLFSILAVISIILASTAFGSRSDTIESFPLLMTSQDEIFEIKRALDLEPGE